MYPKKQVFLVLGLSKSGSAAARFLLSKNAAVYVYDDVAGERVEKVAQELAHIGAKLVAKETLPRMHEVCDVLVLSPGIPIDHPLAVIFKRAGKSVIGETELAARYMRCLAIAVTGTNGKTTTVSMIEAVLKKSGYQANACGNIGTPMIEYCTQAEDAVAVAEISSFQMETLSSFCPHVAVVLNVTEDHLNRHYTMENYIFLKAKLLKNLTESEYAVLNYDDEIVRGFAENTKAGVVWFSVKERVQGAYYENGVLYFNGEKIVSASDLLAEGVHNIQNALATIAVAKIMGVRNAVIADALVAFKGIKHRIEIVGEVEGVAYVDDSKGTNVDATVKAVECMKRETVLLLGGKNKGYDYSKLFSLLKKSKVFHAVLYGENRYALLKSAREQSFESVTVCETFAFAVRVAAMLATSGQCVLLSPASASFDEFASYEERGDAFVKMVRAMQKEKALHTATAQTNRENNGKNEKNEVDRFANRNDGNNDTDGAQSVGEEIE